MKLHLLLLVAIVALSCLTMTDASRYAKPCRGGCRPGYRRVLVTRRVCTRTSRRCAPPTRKRGSLGFVIDDTGSMGDEIASVRSQISATLSANRVFKDYVMARFGDPYKKKVVHTTSSSAIRSYLNAIRPTGGGDCPEYSLSGVRDAANSARPHSVIYLFTDASAKDASLKASVAALLKRKKTRLFVVKSGGLCGSSYKGEYEYLTKASGGSVISLTSKTQVKEIMKYIRLASAGKVPFTLPSTIAKLRRIRPGCCRLVKKCVCRKNKGGCSSSRCPSGYRRSVTRRKICTGGGGGPKPPTRRSGTLGFVIDDTGSMGTEIGAVRSSISSIIAANRRFRNYVIARFGDPYRRKLVKSTRKSTMLSFLNAIRPSGGGDCPEYSLSGVRDAARSALPRSILLLFTDASAKDAHLKASVAALLKRKRTRLYVVKTGTMCGRAYKREYEYLARASGGRVITLSARSGIKNVLNFVKLAAAGKASFRKIPKTLAGLRKYKSRCGKCFTKTTITCVRNRRG